MNTRLTLPFSFPGKGTVTLSGDAFHPMTPNLGQGAALALEVILQIERSAIVLQDSVVLGRRLKAIRGLNANDDEIASALRSYENERLKRAAIVTLRSRAAGKFLGVSFEPVILRERSFFFNSL